MTDKIIELREVTGDKIAFDFLAYKRIILPDVIEEDALPVMQRLLHHHVARENTITIFCGGNGGSTTVARGIVDLIREHGNCDGIVLGVAHSSHSVIWAACARRYFYPSAQIGVHKVYYTYPDKTEFNEDEFANQHAASAMTNSFIASVYARSSNKGVEWWLKEMTNGGASKIIGPGTLMNLEMGLPIERRGMVDTP